MEHIVCSCHNCEHNIFFEKDKEARLVYLLYHLKPLPFFKRIRLGFKYIFGYRSKYGEYEELLIDCENYSKFKSIIDFFENELDNKTIPER